MCVQGDSVVIVVVCSVYTYLWMCVHCAVCMNDSRCALPRINDNEWPSSERREQFSAEKATEYIRE